MRHVNHYFSKNPVQWVQGSHLLARTAFESIRPTLEELVIENRTMSQAMSLDPSLGVHLTEIRRTDVDALVEYLNDWDIYDKTLRIPFPYTRTDAEEWFRISDEMAAIAGQIVNWAIRNAEGKLVGGIGLEGVVPGKSHRAEIGYWLARPYRGRGIMCHVARFVCQHAFDGLAIRKITAVVFPGNIASARVLEKCGFEYEGYLKSHFEKGGQLRDAWAYGLVKKDATR